ncbi:MAG: M23 family metallopeptidase [Actinomycetes bacterium]
MRKLLVPFLTFGLLSLVAVPAQSAPIYTFPISGCAYTYARAHHNYPATDILTHIGCSFVAPTSGTIDEVNRIDRFSWKTNKGADRGGLSVSMIGDDGVRYYGSHLSSIPANVVPGLKVSAGDLIGKTGNSGDAKGTTPHLHFGISWPTPSGKNIWWVRRGELYPWPFLDAWKAGKDLSPAASVSKLEKKVGEIPKQSGY